MKPNVLRLALLTVFASLMFQGYQCGSPEFTGAKVHMQQGNYKEAIRLLEIEVQKNPTNEEAWFFLGGLKADERDYEGMNKAFAEALKLSSRHAKEIYDLRYTHWGQNLNSGVSFLEQASADSAHFYDKSVEAFTRAARAWPDTAVTYRYLGYAHHNKGDLDNALLAYKKAWDLGRDVDAIKRAGWIYNRRGDEHKIAFESVNAEKLRQFKSYEDAKKTNYKNDVIKLLGAPDNIKRGPRGTKKEDWVYNTYKLTFSMDGDKVVGRKLGEPPYDPQIDSTEYHLAQKEYVRAVDVFEKAREADPRDPEILNGLLKSYIESNRIEPAVREFEKAVAGEPENKTNHYILGVLYRTVGDFDKAIEQFKEALRIDPGDCDFLFDLGATYYNWGVDIIRAADEKGEQTDAFRPKFEAALPYMEKVRECKEDDPAVWETLGTIYARLGDQDNALKAFETADKIRKGR